MKIISALSSPHQDDVIERILRARGEWDPPWQRAGKVRGPPRQLEFEEAEFSQVAPASSGEFDQTVPSDSPWRRIGFLRIVPISPESPRGDSGLIKAVSLKLLILGATPFILDWQKKVQVCTVVLPEIPAVFCDE